MAKSLMQDNKECYICKTTLGLHKHHIFFGTSHRKLSDKYGCWCYLCGAHHNLSSQGVHFNPLLDSKLKRECQERFEKEYGADLFKTVFRKNYKV